MKGERRGRRRLRCGPPDAVQIGGEKKMGVHKGDIYSVWAVGAHKTRGPTEPVPGLCSLLCESI